MSTVVAGKMFSFDPQCICMFCMILTVSFVPVTSVNSINLAIFVIRWGCVLCELRTAVFFLCHWQHTPYACCNFVTELRRQEAEVLQNHDNENVRDVGLGQTQRRKLKRLRHCGCEAWHISGDWDAGVVCVVCGLNKVNQVVVYDAYRWRVLTPHPRFKGRHW